MTTVVSDLKDANALAFAALAMVCLMQWRRNRNLSSAWVALAFGSLATVAIIGQILPSEPARGAVALWLIKGLLVVLILFPYWLFRFAATFDKPRRELEALATAFTVAAVIGSLAIPRMLGPNDPKPPWMIAYTIVVLSQWTFLFSVVSWRLWRAGKGQATVPKRRMRTLAFGSIGLNLAVLLSSLTPASRPSAALVATQVLSSLCAFFFFVGFAPPKLLLFLWRRREMAAVAGIMQNLISATSLAQVSDLLLPATRVVGASGAAFVSSTGEIVARTGPTVTQEECDRVIAEAAQKTPCDRSVLIQGMRSGKIVIWMSPYAPFFGSEEMEMMQQLSVLADIAMERCTLIEQQRSFIANAAHELRTPLTTILGLSLTLGRYGDQISESEHQECVTALERQGERARTLINNLLDMAQLDSGRLLMSIEPVSVAVAAERALTVAPPPEGTEVEVLIESGVHAVANAERLEQILVNLLVNAYQYGDSPIRIRARQDGDDVVVDISDSGPGVPEELAPHLFDPFTRAAGSSSKGSGLGLSITRRLTEAFGGSIHYSSASPRGACFNIRLKRAA